MIKANCWLLLSGQLLGMLSEGESTDRRTEGPLSVVLASAHHGSNETDSFPSSAITAPRPAELPMHSQKCVNSLKQFDSNEGASLLYKARFPCLDGTSQLLTLRRWPSLGLMECQGKASLPARPSRTVYRPGASCQLFLNLWSAIHGIKPKFESRMGDKKLRKEKKIQDQA